VKRETSDIEPLVEALSTTVNQVVPGEIIIGVFEGLDEQGAPLVDFTENMKGKPLVAISTVTVTQDKQGEQVALLFAEGNIEKPVIMGLIHNPLSQIIENFEINPADDQFESKAQINDQSDDAKIDNAYVDGKRVVLEGKEEIVLKCGEASITLTKAGKILIRGKYLLNRSTGVNRIMGGSVQVN